MTCCPIAPRARDAWTLLRGVVKALAVVCLMASSGCSSSPATGGGGACLSQRSADDVAECVAGKLSGGRSPSWVIGVRRGAAESFIARGRIANGVDDELDEHTFFRIASSTKPVVGALVLILAQRGEFSLNTRVQSIVPELVQPQAEGLELWHLLEHRSGFAEVVGKLPSPDEYPELEFVALPGGPPSYSNINYAVLGLLLQRVSGKDLQTLVDDELPILRGRFHFGEPSASKVARGILPGVFAEWDAQLALPAWIFQRGGDDAAARGGVATPAAMLAFVHWLFMEHELELDPSAQRCSRGWFASSKRGAWWHNGALSPHGWQSLLYAQPDTETFVVVLSNRDLLGGDLPFAALDALEYGTAGGLDRGPPSVVGSLFGLRFVAWFGALLLAAIPVERRRGWLLWCGVALGVLPVVALLSSVGAAAAAGVVAACVAVVRTVLHRRPTKSESIAT